MRVIGSWLVASIVLGSSALGGGAERNAALRYWMAFAEMENPPAESELAKRLASVADGKEPWAESLAPIVERNEEALAIMYRGSRLDGCDWGYEHELLSETPIANIPRARTLARLNVLHGMRLWQQGRSAQAVDAWLAGIRFSRHILAEGPWLSALVAAGSLRAHLGALSRAVGERKLDPAALSRIERAITALPEAGFDWSVAARVETGGLSGHLAALEAKATDEGTRGSLRRARALSEELRPRLVAAFQAPPESSRQALAEIDARARQDSELSPIWPSTVRFNETRSEVVQARAELLALLRGR
jgi:hypothetical protein